MKLTTSVFVILASRSVRLSPHCDWSVESSCRPQIAAPTLPVAIMEGGYMANLKSVREEEREKHQFSARAIFFCSSHKEASLVVIHLVRFLNYTFDSCAPHKRVQIHPNPGTI